MEVSVVIPTRFRPQAVVRAARSALDQQGVGLEVVVVIDGPDPDTLHALAAITDPRLQVIALAANGGPSAARNTGVREARGEWIALLDDDDEFLPDKLARQLAAARASAHSFPILACRAIAQAGSAAYVWPARLPGGLPLSDYLLDRPGPFRRPGYVTASMLMARRDMFLRVPMPRPDHDGHEDWGWLLEASAVFASPVIMLPEALCRIQVATHASRSKHDDWRASAEWAERYRHRMTARAYAAFLATKVAGKARRQGDWAALPHLLKTAFRQGEPTPMHLLLFAGTWLLPPWAHRRVQAASFADCMERVTP